MNEKKFYQINTKSFKEGNHKELWEKAQKEGYEGLSVNVKSKFKKIDGNKKYKVTLSTSDLDRHGDIVKQSFVHDEILPFIDSHQYGSIFHILGSVTDIKQGRKKTTGDVLFSTYREAGREAEQMAENGDLRKVSIGFIPLKFNKEGDIVEAELLELSGCSVSANNWAEFEKVERSIKTEDDEQITTPPEENESGESEIEENEENGSVEPSEVSPTPPEGGDIPEEGDENEEKSAPQRVGEGLNDKIVKMRAEQVETLSRIAEGLIAANPNERKRKIYKTLREAFKSR